MTSKPFWNKGTKIEQDMFNRGRYFINLQHMPSGEKVYFKALVTQFEDQFSSEWNTETVFGRMDPIRGFRATQRIISLGWDVVAADLEEAKENMRQSSKLLSMLYPSYDATATMQETVTGQSELQDQANQANVLSANPRKGASNNAGTIKSAPIFKLRFNNLIQDAKSKTDFNNSVENGLLGTIDGLTYAPDLEQGFFDPITDEATGTGGILYPQTIKFAFGFYVAHDHPLGWGTDKSFRTQNYPRPDDSSNDGSGGE